VCRCIIARMACKSIQLYYCRRQGYNSGAKIFWSIGSTFSVQKGTNLAADVGRIFVS
jgi:hypothetical protein